MEKNEVLKKQERKMVSGEEFLKLIEEGNINFEDEVADAVELGCISGCSWKG